YSLKFLGGHLVQIGLHLPLHHIRRHVSLAAGGGASKRCAAANTTWFPSRLREHKRFNIKSNCEWHGLVGLLFFLSRLITLASSSGRSTVTRANSRRGWHL